MKDRVYKNKPATIEELKANITAEVARITPEILQNVQEAVYVRLGHFETQEGRHFEHLL